MFYKGMNFVFFDFETTGIKANGLESDDLPIELGMVLTDENLILKDNFQTYITWPWMDSHIEWPPPYQNAYEIHKIDINTIKKNGEPIDHTIFSIKNFINKNIKDSEKLPTLVSDNAYFDTLMMHKLFNESGSPYEFYKTFHYTTWDINMLYKAAGIKKASEYNHDALGDAANMWHRTLRSLQKINYFEN